MALPYSCIICFFTIHLSCADLTYQYEYQETVQWDSFEKYAWDWIKTLSKGGIKLGEETSSCDVNEGLERFPLLQILNQTQAQMLEGK